MIVDIKFEIRGKPRCYLNEKTRKGCKKGSPKKTRSKVTPKKAIDVNADEKIRSDRTKTLSE